MKKLIAILIITASSILSYGQANVLNAKSPSEIGVTTPEQDKFDNNKPLEYGFVADKDILFSKTIWEVIDLDQRVNFPLFFPVDTSVVGKERRPLVHYLLNGVQSGTIKNYYLSDNLKDIMTPENLSRRLKYRKIREDVPDKGMQRIVQESGNMRDFLRAKSIAIPSEYEDFDAYNTTDPEKLANYQSALSELILDNGLLEPEEYSEAVFDYADVVEYRIKGIWYFDAKLGELKYRPIALAPIIETPQSKAENEDSFVALFWVFYPDVRDVLYKADAFNEKNTSRPISFDDLINAHRFSGYIFKEDNVYQDREIEKYIPKNALLRLLESDRIRDKIRNLEHDMWSW
jgi:gliding motility associated protien GldN